MCGGFTFTKNSLMALNMLYTLVSCILIGIGTYARVSSIVTSINFIEVFIGCGIFLAFLSLMGLWGAAKHHQVVLFFYMCILFFLFIIQFAVACACLAVTDKQRVMLATKGWHESDNNTRYTAENYFDCCGFISSPSVNECLHVTTCCPSEDSCTCSVCRPKIVKALSWGLDVSGGAGMFFSFTEFLGVWLTIRYRNQKNPRANPSAFL
ncbi:tetraspanin 97E [Brevipalpus obovatus]|uniref:tetraspanin 97E n=1 Tax=Brevipalpus obovatus TaxID=246614 RepID=UPI003D9DC283